MAWFYGINFGERLDQAVNQATDPSRDISIVISNTAQARTGDQRLDVDDLILLVERLKEAILQSGRAW
jgi:hypothetical protein